MDGPGSRLRRPRVVFLAAVMLAVVVAVTTGAGATGQTTPSNDPPVGFGRATTGGAGGDLYKVTNLDDSGPGSLREGAERPGRLRIEFDVSGTIRPEKTVMVGADKTMDGHGATVTISGRGLTLTQPNVIVRNMFFADLTPPDILQDAIHIATPARNVWIDHNTMTGAGDKLIGMESGTDATISWNWFHNQYQVIQLGNFSTADAARDIRVTLHHNLFTDNGYRQPRASYGKVHAFNNYVRNWEVHGMSSVRGAELASEANIFEPGEKKNATVITGVKDEKDDTPGFIRSVGDLALNGAVIKESQPERVFNPASDYPYTASPADDALRTRIQNGAGVEGAVKPPTPSGPTTVPPQRQPKNKGTQPGEAAPAQKPPSSDSGSPLLLVLVLVGVGAAVVTAVVVVVRSRSRRARGAG